MIWTLPAAMMASLAFSIVFQASPRHWILCSLTGGIGWLVYSLFAAIVGAEILPALIAAMQLTFFARLFAYIKTAPVMVFLVAGIFPLVPGTGVYYTAYYGVQANYSLMFSHGMNTLMIAGAIVLGILFGLAIPNRLIQILSQIKKHNQQ